MSTVLPLTWLDKKNSPELEAFLKQYGDQYVMTAEEINQLRDAVNEMAVIQQSTFFGVAEPTDPNTSIGAGYWEVITPGTYPNHGGVVLGTDQRGLISVTATGVFKISKVAFSFAAYAKTVDVNKINVWTAKAYEIGDQVNYLGKDWTANAVTVAGDVPNTSSKWQERLKSYINDYITPEYLFSVVDKNGHILLFIDNLGVLKGKQFIEDINYSSIVPRLNTVTDSSGIAYAITTPTGKVIFYIDSYGYVKGKIKIEDIDTSGLNTRLNSIEDIPNVYYAITTPSGKAIFYIDADGVHYNGKNIVSESSGVDSLVFLENFINKNSIINTIDLASISFVPSVTKLNFPSIAFGDETSPGVRSQITLTDSGWTHPSVRYFKNGWNGFKYWCAITPYPNSDSQYENPHIFCSQDGKTWLEPSGIQNPIAFSDTSSIYSSDVCLVYNDDGYLYCYWRDNNLVIDGLVSRCMYVKKSRDGVNWSSKVMTANWSASTIDVIAPAIVKTGTFFHCYGVSTNENITGSYYTARSIRKMVSKNELSFDADIAKGYDLIKIEGRPWGANQEPWHTDVQKIDNVWFMLVTTTDNGQYGANGRLFLGYSFDGVNFTFNNNPICSSIGTYKSAFLPSIDLLNKKINIQLWRALQPNNWTVFYDEFKISFT